MNNYFAKKKLKKKRGHIPEDISLKIHYAKQIIDHIKQQMGLDSFEIQK